MAQQITYDKAYDTVAPGDFPAMLEVPRYGRRTDAFDSIISATHDHFWDPLDKNYIDFDQPFDMALTPVMPLDTVVELRSAVADRLDDRQKIQLGNDVMHWSISNLLHGEQGALSLSASLCHILVDPGAQEYAANQAREEARHVAGFTRYIAKRWGEPLPVGKTIATVLADLVEHAGGLQEDRRHADADRRRGDGLVRDAERQDQRSRAAPAGPAGDERRGVPSSLRPHLGLQDDPPSQPGRAPQGRGLGGPDLPDAAVQPDQHRAEAGHLRQVRARLAMGARCGQGGLQRRGPPRPAQGRQQHLPRADQDAAACRHHHRGARRRSTRCGST